MIRRKDLHRPTSARLQRARLHNSLIMAQLEPDLVPHVLFQPLRNINVPSQLIDLVLVVGKDMTDAIVAHKFYNILALLASSFRRHDRERHVLLLQTRLQQLQAAEDEIAARR